MRALPLLLTLSASVLQSAEPAWLTDLEAGRKAARQAGQSLLVHFTGSAWCPACKLLHAEVLTTPAFGDFARGLVLVKLDYPPLSERAAAKVKADPALGRLMDIKGEFKVTGFPTTVLLAPDGRELARKEGYGKGEGAAAYLAGLRKAP